MARQLCKLRPAHKAIRALLLLSGVPKQSLPAKCEKWTSDSTNCPCQNFLSHARNLYYYAAGDASKEIYKFIEDIFGTDPPLSNSFHPKLIKHNKFRCPELSIFMYQPCSVSSCRFHSKDNPWTSNCILRYMTKQECTTLSYNDLTNLFSTPQMEIRSCLLGAVKKLRNGALKEIIVEENETGMFDRLSSDTICPVCERPIKEDEEVIKHDLHYCSEYCLYMKPPVVLDLEHEFCIDIKALLKTCTTRFLNVSIMSNALDVDKPTFLELCHIHEIEVAEHKL